MFYSPQELLSYRRLHYYLFSKMCSGAQNKEHKGKTLNIRTEWQIFKDNMSCCVMVSYVNGVSANRKLTWMWPSQRAEQSSVLIGSIKQLHWVVHCCLEDCKLTKHNWRRRKIKIINGFLVGVLITAPIVSMHGVIISLFTKLWGHSDVVGTGLSGGVV